METINLVDYPAIAEIVKLVSKKRKAFLAKRTTCVCVNFTYWSGGSRDQYYLIGLRDKNVVPLENSNPPQFGGATTEFMQPLYPGFAIVKAGTFCGKPATPTIYFHPDQQM